MSLFALLPRVWREGAIACLLIVIAVLGLSKAMSDRRNAMLTIRLREANALIERERAAVRAATALARAKDAADAARIERDQVKVSQEVTDDYQKQLADLRRRHDALRLHAAAPATAAGGGGGAGVSGVPDAARGVDGAAGEDRLPASDALIASEQALRLSALQAWVREQAGVER